MGGTRTSLPPHRDGFRPAADRPRPLPVLRSDPVRRRHAVLRELSSAGSRVSPTASRVRSASTGRMPVARRRRSGTWRSCSRFSGMPAPVRSRRRRRVRSFRRARWVTSRRACSRSLNANATYRRLFRQAFPRRVADTITAAAGLYRAGGFPDVAGFAQQPLRPLCARLRRRAERARNRRSQRVPLVRGALLRNATRRRCSPTSRWP